MSRSHKTPSRRAILRGAASSLALPFLPSLLPRSARGATTGPPRRMVAWLCPNGMLPTASVPATSGTLGTELPVAIAPLASIVDRATVLTDLRNIATQDARAGCDHSRGLGTLLNDRSVDITQPTFNAAITFDQVAANALAGSTPFASMQFGIEGDDGFCSFSNNDCAYQGVMSWASPTAPLFPSVSPQAVFDQLFRGADPTASVREAAARRDLRYSVLDRTMDRTSALSAQLSAADRDKLDQYLTGIRDLENRLVQLDGLVCDEPLRPNKSMPLPEHHAAMRDLMVLAIQCDYTRIITFLAGHSASSLVYSHLDLVQRTTHHLTSHHLNDPRWMADLATIEAWLVEQFVGLATALAAIDDGEGGDLLQHTALLYLTEFGDPYVHQYEELTWILAGGEAAGWSHGQHRPQGARPHSDVFLNLFDFIGVPMASFGENGRAPVDLT